MHFVGSALALISALLLVSDSAHAVTPQVVLDSAGYVSTSTNFGSAPTSGAVSADTMYLNLHTQEGGAGEYDEICVQITSTGGTSAFSFAVYDLDADGRPEELIYYATGFGTGTVGKICADFSSQGTKVESSYFDALTGDLELPDNSSVWVAVQRTTGGTPVQYTRNPASTHVLGFVDSNPGSAPVRGFKVPSSTSFPDPLVTEEDSTLSHPMIWLHKI